MIKSLPHSFTALLLLSLMVTGCQKKGAPHEEEEEQTIDAVFMALDENAPPLNCGEGGTPVPIFYTEEIANGFCRLEVPLVDSAAKSKRGIGAVIKNKAAFDKFFTCRETRPPIDFDNYFVLAGIYGHTSSPVILIQKEVSVCNNKLLFKMELGAGIAAQPGGIFIMIAIERKYIDKDVLIDMRIVR